ncbi:hypothetical protein LZ318_06145 [Saccharopolyspora indica]|uniref:hypothetical protein n=1 Tax=Saccharopolyspora indica TaxID=1229659 RepID=UPI0022EB319D|nr:hypothetical protein [Saccharopolyspora indica]MDA3648845.1 hypothetical protein [Saccharopolyspora indica]
MSDSGGGGRVRRFRKWFVIAAVVLLVGAGGYGFWQQYPAAMVGKACDGMLPVDPILELSGASRLSLIGSDFELAHDGQEEIGSQSVDVTCKVGNAHVRIETPDESMQTISFYSFRGNLDSFPVPLEAGWSGLVANSDRVASVLVGCRNWERDEGNGIAVTVDRSEGESIPGMRPNLVRAAIETARSAAERTGCDAQFGGDVELAVPGGTDRTVPAAEASGTCAGMSSAEAVRETDAATAPGEKCVLVDGLELTAMYGHFEEAYASSLGFDEPSGANGYYIWTSATCPSPLDRGLFTASVLEGTDRSFNEEPLDDAELADLQRFAQQSAARHGCTPPGPIGRTR